MALHFWYYHLVASQLTLSLVNVTDLRDPAVFRMPTQYLSPQGAICTQGADWKKSHGG